MDIVVLARQQMPQDWTDRIGPILVVVLLLVLAILIGYANYQNARPFRIDSSTSLAPEQSLDLLQAQLARDGWRLGYRGDTTLIMNIESNVSLGSTAAIGCFSVWLGLLHILTSHRSVSVEFLVEETASGNRITTNGSRSGSYLTYTAHHLKELPKT